MGKKSKEKKTDKSGKTKHDKVEQKINKLEKQLAETRGKIHKLLAKSAKMDVQDYVLKDKDNKDVKLSEMFGDKKDLILIHNMGKSCSYCTLWADGFSGVTYFMEKKAAFAVVSPDAPEVQKAFAGERGWKFKMYSGKDSSFIKDMGYVTDAGSYWPGASIFHKSDDGNIRRESKTYFGPGDDYCSVWHFFDLLPKSSKDKEEKLK